MTASTFTRQLNGTTNGDGTQKTACRAASENAYDGAANKNEN